MTWRTRPRKYPVRGVVVHWNGRGGDVVQTRRTLVGRNLSCHAFVDATGHRANWDTDDQVTLHAGRWSNDLRLGVETQSRGFAKPDETVYYTDRVHGRLRRMLFWPEPMLVGVAEWCEEKAQAHGFPLAVPTVGGELVRRRLQSCGYGPSRDCALPNDLCRTHFRGVLGHYHVTNLNDRGVPIKTDPGTAPLLWLARRWGLDVR